MNGPEVKIVCVGADPDIGRHQPDVVQLVGRGVDDDRVDRLRLHLRYQGWQQKIPRLGEHGTFSGFLTQFQPPQIKN